MTDRVSPPLDSATGEGLLGWSVVGMGWPSLSTWGLDDHGTCSDHGATPPPDAAVWTALLLLRSAKQIILSMIAWIDRGDGNDLKASRAELEGVIQRAYAEAG